jgi:hypothetical protein
VDVDVRAERWAQGEVRHPDGAASGAVPASCANGVGIERGRKLRAPADEKRGVPTYTALWGRPMAAGAWLGALVPGLLRQAALGLASSCTALGVADVARVLWTA